MKTTQILPKKKTFDENYLSENTFTISWIL
jgi:hypothetical protein